MAAAHHAVKSTLIPALDLWDVLLPVGYKIIFNEDNSAMIQVVTTGRNPTMKHLNRVHRIDVRFLHEQIFQRKSDIPILIMHADSELMCADIYTKIFTEPVGWTHACDLINIF